MRSIIFLAGVLFSAVGYTRVEYLDYRGQQTWPTGSALFMKFSRTFGVAWGAVD